MKIFAFADEASPYIDGQIAAMKRNGLDGLEIRTVDGQSVSDITEAKAAEVKLKLQDAGLAVWSVGSPIGKTDIENDDFGAHLETFRRTIETAGILGAKNMRIFSFFIPKGRNALDYRGEVIDRMGRLLEIAKEYGVTLCHENEKGIYGDTAPRCYDLLSVFPELEGVFDPANFIQCGQNTAVAWTMLSPRVKYLHIKDALENGKVVPAGRGVGNLRIIVNSFMHNGGQAVTVEPHLAVFPALSSLEREGQSSEIDEFAYPSPDAAFDAAVAACREIMD